MEPVTRKGMFIDAICDGEPCNLEPATREEVLLKRLAESGGGGGVSSWNDLTDKPFGEETTRGFIVPETEAAFVDGGGMLSYAAQGDPLPLIAGQTYSVSWNGSEYDCIANELDASGGGMYVITLGDASAFGGNGNGEPFFLYVPTEATSSEMNGLAFAVASLDGSNTAVISVVGEVTTVKQIELKYIPDGAGGSAVGKATSDAGEIFNDYDSNEAAAFAHAEGNYTRATGEGAHTEGYNTQATGPYSHAEGEGSIARGRRSHAEGRAVVESGGSGAHAEGDSTASEMWAHSEGQGTVASGSWSHAEGYGSKAAAAVAHAEGRGTLASSSCQHTQGKYNVEDSAGIYAHIVGNGDSTTERSNAHTLDWSGNAWFAGTVEGTAIIIKSSTDGSVKRFRITVDDSGELKATEIESAVVE